MKKLFKHLLQDQTVWKLSLLEEAAPNSLIKVAELHSEMKAHRRPEINNDEIIFENNVDGIEIYTVKEKVNQPVLWVKLYKLLVEELVR